MFEAVHILVVDDEPDLQALIRQRFRNRIGSGELAFDFASNGAEALEKLQGGGHVDILLTDINMPVMDGLTLLTQLGSVHRNGPLKAVIVSAYGDMENIRTAMNRGAFDFITKPIDFRDLEITIDKTATELRQLKEAMASKARLVAVEEELNVAREIQQALLPRALPVCPASGRAEVFAEMLPARHVGGDFFDFFLIGDDHIGFAVGDVAGKGVPAALFMGTSRMLLKAAALKGEPPHVCLNEVNRVLCAENQSCMFLTLCYGVLDTTTGRVSYSIGGHNPPYRVAASGRVESLDTRHGIVLGVFDDAQFESESIELAPGDSLFLYTDGVSEAMDIGRDLFGADRLEACLAEAAGKPAEELARGVVTAVRAFSNGAPQNDDITVVALRYKGA